MTHVIKPALLAASLLFSIVSLAQTTAQTTAKITAKITQWLDEPPQFLYLYSELEALTGESVFVDMITVDKEGNFLLPTLSKSGEQVVILESPPWIWRAVINTESPGQLVLHMPTTGPTKLRGVPAQYSYLSEDSPLELYDQFRSRVLEIDYLSAYDRMAQSGAVGAATNLVNKTYLDSLDAVFHAEFTSVFEQELISNSAYYSDLVMALSWKWRRESGEKTSELRSSWKSGDAQKNGRPLSELITSPGWVQSWAEVHYDWFAYDRPTLNGYVTSGSIESIAAHLDCSQDEAHLAMWWWDLNAPTQMTDGWWARYEDTMIGKMRSRAITNEDLFTSENFQDLMWTTPSTDIVCVDELYGMWTAILVLKYESIASRREWGAFRSISESIGVKRGDIRFFVLCIDGDENSWTKVLRTRQSSSEMVRWVGADARWMNGLDLNSVPQIVVISPGLDIYNYTAPMPSLGLRTYLETLPK